MNVRDRIRRLPAGEVIVRGTVFLVGAALITLGLVAVVLPGPLTIPPILLGLLVWSLEFDFAKKWLDRAMVPAQKAWDEAQEHPWRTGLVSGGGIVLMVAAGVLVAHFELIARARDALG